MFPVYKKAGFVCFNYIFGYWGLQCGLKTLQQMLKDDKDAQRMYELPRAELAVALRQQVDDVIYTQLRGILLEFSGHAAKTFSYLC